MKQYIDKSDVLAEIERRLEKIANVSSENNTELATIHGAQIYELINLAQYINTLEVKEVDLNREIDLWIRNLHSVPNFEELNKFAKHFFELGLKAKGE